MKSIISGEGQELELRFAGAGQYLTCDGVPAGCVEILLNLERAGEFPE